MGARSVLNKTSGLINWSSSKWAKLFINEAKPVYMPGKHASNTHPRILATVALYEQSPSGSRALLSLAEILRNDRGLAHHVGLMIYDNSPEAHEINLELPLEYVHDAKNSGLAAAYNCGLLYAEENGYDWLLLLDQDTTLTSCFMSELITSLNALRPEDPIVAVVPKLLVRGVIQSPAEHFIDYIRHQFKRSNKTFDNEFGVQHGRISAYNSGSTLSVRALRAIGGFPLEFWLDYLDHAVFHALCERGGKVYVLRAVLIHDLAESDLNLRPLWRFRNVLRAQSLFVRRVGNQPDQLLYRLWLLRGIRRLRADVVDKRVWRETAWQAIFCHTRKPTGTETARRLP